MFSENELKHLIKEEENSVMRSFYLQLVLTGYCDLEGETLSEKIVKDLINDDTLYTSH